MLTHGTQVRKADSQPSQSQVHINGPLTNISIAYLQAGTMASRAVFPMIGSRKRSNDYFLYSLDDFNRIEVKKRGEGAASAGGGYRLSTDTYRIEKYALHIDVTDDMKDNADSPLSPHRDATTYLTQNMMLFEEREWAARYFQPGVWGTDLQGGGAGANSFAQWDSGVADPIETIDHWRTEMKRMTGKKPNVLTVGPETWVRGLKNHPALLDRIKHTQRGVLTTELVAQLLEVDRVLVADLMQVTGDEQATFDGSADGDKEFLLGRHALLSYAPSTPSLREASAGYSFVGNTSTMSAAGPVIKQFRKEPEESDCIEIQMGFDQKVVAPDLGIFFNEAVSAT